MDRSINEKHGRKAGPSGQFYRRKGRAYRWAYLTPLLLATWSMIAWTAARALIVRSELPQADALVVLGGSATYVERAHRAVELFDEGRAPRIILTNDGRRGGWSGPQQRNPLFVERAMDELKQARVPSERIEVLPEPVSGTYDESIQLREYAGAHGMRSILVVTSAYHSRRALWTMRHIFRGSGIEVGLDIVPPGDQTPSPAMWWWHWYGWQMVAGEYVKLIYYVLRYH